MLTLLSSSHAFELQENTFNVSVNLLLPTPCLATSLHHTRSFAAVFSKVERAAWTNHFTSRRLTRCPMSHVLPTWAASECCQYVCSMCTRRCLLCASCKPVFLLWKALLFARFFVKFSACLGLARAERICDRICSMTPEMVSNLWRKTHRNWPTCN